MGGPRGEPPVRGERPVRRATGGNRDNGAPLTGMHTVAERAQAAAPPGGREKRARRSKYHNPLRLWTLASRQDAPATPFAGAHTHARYTRFILGEHALKSGLAQKRQHTKIYIFSPFFDTHTVIVTF